MKGRGNPLDPPLRSRFQSCVIPAFTPRALIHVLRQLPGAPLPPQATHRLLSFVAALKELVAARAQSGGTEAQELAFKHLPLPGEVGLVAAARAMQLFPGLSTAAAIWRVYPWNLVVFHPEAVQILNSALHELNSPADTSADSGRAEAEVHELRSITAGASAGSDLQLVLGGHGGSAPPWEVRVPARCGAAAPRHEAVERLTTQQRHTLTGMLQTHALERDLCLVGARGEGKSEVARAFASVLGYAPVETVFLYADMTSRDLFQRRTIGPRGETTWQSTPLVRAMVAGRLAVLDGIQRLPPGVFAALLRLVEDRDMTLADGTRFMQTERYEALQRKGADVSRVRRIAPGFRLLVLGTPPERARCEWLGSELLQMFDFHGLGGTECNGGSRGDDPVATGALLGALVPDAPPSLCSALAQFAHLLEGAWRAAGGDAAAVAAPGAASVMRPPSLRQLLRAARRGARHPADVFAAVSSGCMARFAPAPARAQFTRLAGEAGLGDAAGWEARLRQGAAVRFEGGEVTIGETSSKLVAPQNPALVPDIVFVEIPQQMATLESMLRDMLLHEHLLLLGNQARPFARAHIPGVEAERPPPPPPARRAPPPPQCFLCNKDTDAGGHKCKTCGRAYHNLCLLLLGVEEMACCGAEECKKNLQISAESQEERNAKQAEAAVTGAAPQEALELEVSPAGEPAPAAVVEEPQSQRAPRGEPAPAALVDPPQSQGARSGPACANPRAEDGVVWLPMLSAGVGKNKLCDRLLQLLQREREYVQLHRDTTVGQLTLSPSLQGGTLVWEDSPLVRAMTHGRVLVVDEADKAAPEVVCVLKGLLEDGEILLPDGRRFVSERSCLYSMTAGDRAADARQVWGAEAGDPGDALMSGDGQLRRVHPGFHLIALANRPGFPFLGNDFFAEMGDSFACHAVDNPDLASETQLLRSFAPNTPLPIVQALAAVFARLREMADEGVLSYPYSTREAVAVVRHVEAHPADALSVALHNVLGFDAFNSGVSSTLKGVFRDHGIPLQELTELPDADAAAASTALAVPTLLRPPGLLLQLFYDSTGEDLPLTFRPLSSTPAAAHPAGAPSLATRLIP
ncbi:hypothetical protein CYMTET_23568 [Cymbomonas tetramitiformis]|uniref:ATPase dynein-related AAA domain-containing protein n=1 Tax=Cymbomonas tetramitiformis TaxID=36881 RepID=A0AAE0FYD0_9CHLO|nr:hypothetical protein CYMTET_23568 [Cymbomonas tetramitiformis]